MNAEASWMIDREFEVVIVEGEYRGARGSNTFVMPLLSRRRRVFFHASACRHSLPTAP